MSDELTDFVWRVPERGYRWCTALTDHSTPHRVLARNGRLSPSRFLVFAIADTQLQPGTEYQPLLQQTGLFKQLADTPATEEAILEFANRYGHLGGFLKVPLTVHGDPDVASGEPFEEWKVAILQLRDVVQTWEAAKTRNLTALSRRIHWQSDGVMYRSESDSAVIATSRDADLMARFAPGDLLLPAMYLVQRRINQQLQTHQVSPRLLWNQREAALVMRLSATSLLGALWLQFAKAVEGNREYRQCQNEHCRLWFEVGGNRTARSDKKFCSPSCKADAHRQKREQALCMHHQAGANVSAIAAKLELEEGTVKRWIEKKELSHVQTKTRSR